MKISRIVRLGLVLAAGVVILRWWFLEILLVPSDSMEPLFHGDPVRGDQVAVFKPYYHFVEPGRFDLVVFQPPDRAFGTEQGRYMIKRVVALGGELVQIRGGDLFISPRGSESPKIFVKSYSDFGRLLIPVWDDRFEQPLIERWSLGSERAPEQDAGKPVLSGSADWRRALSLFSRLAVTNRVDDAAGQEKSGSQVVHDALLRVELTALAENSGLVVRLNEQQDLFWFALGGRPEGENVTILHETTDEQAYPARTSFGGLKSGSRHVVEVWNIDDNLGIALDGEVLLTFQHVEVPESLGNVRLGVSLGVFGGRARIERVALARDMYYTDPGPGGQDTGKGVLVPEDSLYVLGDLSQESEDSRHFGPIRRSSLVGRPFAVCLPLSRARWID